MKKKISNVSQFEDCINFETREEDVFSGKIAWFPYPYLGRWGECKWTVAGVRFDVPIIGLYWLKANLKFRYGLPQVGKCHDFLLQAVRYSLFWSTTTLDFPFSPGSFLADFRANFHTFLLWNGMKAGEDEFMKRLGASLEFEPEHIVAFPGC
jgi:hypothetical protein